MSSKVFVDARWHRSFVHMNNELTDAVLFRLTSEALLTYLGHAETFEFTMQPGCASALSGVSVADLNYVVAGPGASDDRPFADACEPLISRDLPFLAVVFPEAASHVEQTAARLGLEHVVDFPFMCAMTPHRAPALLEAPNLDVFLAWIDDRVVGTVTLIHQGDATGVWSMGTDPALQRSGIGRRLLSLAVAEARMQGCEALLSGSDSGWYPAVREPRLHDSNRHEGLGIGRNAPGVGPLRNAGQRLLMAPPDGLEPPTQALGRPRSVH